MIDKSEWRIRPSKYRKVIAHDRAYYLPLEGVNVADHFKYVINPGDDVHVTDVNQPIKKDRPFSGTMQGYGGSTLEFPLADGTVDKVKGPWHTHSEALFKATGINISELHLSTVVISTDEGEGFMQPGNDIIYEETQAVLGHFMRGARMAQQLADVLQIPLYCVRESAGGGSAGWHNPGDKLHPMAERDIDHDRS